MVLSTAGKNYRPEIDGVRALAIIPVILFHLNSNYIQGGYYGVDVFFVISGYLITRIIEFQIVQGTFKMSQFWIRRVNRLLPTLLVVVLITVISSLLVVFKPTVSRLGCDIIPGIFSYSNYHALYAFGNYWGGESQSSFFLHLWSLAVEEQFYLVYPLVLFFCYKKFHNIRIVVLLSFVLSFGYFIYTLKIRGEIDIAFYTLPSRIWELSAGGLVALYGARLAQIKRKKLWAFLGLLLVFYAYFFGGKTIGFHVIYAVLGASLIICFAKKTNPIGKLLSNSILVFIGKISYSLYLWHWCVIVFVQNFKFQLFGINAYLIHLCIFVLSIVLSTMSYYWIENKTRNNCNTPKIVLGGVLLVIGLTLFIQSNLFSIVYDSKYSKQNLYNFQYDISPNQMLNEADEALLVNCNLMPREDLWNSAFKEKGIVLNAFIGEPTLMLLGDSHGVMWAKLMNELSDSLRIPMTFFTANSGKPFVNWNQIEKQEANGHFNALQRVEYARALKIAVEKQRLKLVVIAVRWDQLNEKEKAQLHELLQDLELRGLKVLLLTQPPVLNFMENKNTAQFATYLHIEPVIGFNTVAVNSQEVMLANQYVYSLANQFKNTRVYDVYQNMLLEGRVKLSLNRDILYFDDDHLSYTGASIHKKAMTEILVEENLTEWK
jgi:peptidoglycan/LPS O-acetylase OafA/YrhL